jgi:hypothetical protein
MGAPNTPESFGLPDEAISEVQGLINETIHQGGIDILPTVVDPGDAQLAMRREAPGILRAVQGSGRLALVNQAYRTRQDDLGRAA